ncbi:hypothetical protein M9Y10_009737 [Tritrichomonas musculus]|uniref:Uncharacterized protein n=1 Tax=Tritrichomonas musculus TaxID=1915356 RepID=A0ABR2IQJ6_9EUKA
MPQFIQQQQQQQQFQNNDNETPDFNIYLQQSEQYSENTISSKSTHDKNIRAYESIMAQFKQQPYPISREKIKVFITYQAQHGISHYFKCNVLPNLILSNEFKKFKRG